MNRIPAGALIVGLVAPLVIVTVSVVAGWSWLPDLPATVAIHWGGNGTADGFGAPLDSLLQLGAISGGLSMLFAGIVIATARGGLSMPQKLLLLLSPSVSVLLMTITLVSLAAQRGLADAADAPSPVGALILGLVLALVVAVTGWLLLPKVQPAGTQDAATPAATALSSTDRALWTRSASAPRWLRVGVLLVVAIAAIPVVTVANPASWLWAVLAVFAVIVTSSLAWRVRIDNGGVVVRSIFGLPRFRVRLADIESATVLTVHPLEEFGGWGIRFGSGRRVGIILNGGDALEVHRTKGPNLVVTVDDAATAASLVNGLVARARLGIE